MNWECGLYANRLQRNDIFTRRLQYAHCVYYDCRDYYMKLRKNSQREVA